MLPGALSLARVTTATTGTGTITLGAAVLGYLTFAQAGAVNGGLYYYSIIDGANSECGIGTYTAAGTTFSRDTIARSTGAGNNTKISLSGNAQVFITALAESFGTMAAQDASAVAITGGTFTGTLSGTIALSGVPTYTQTISGVGTNPFLTLSNLSAGSTDQVRLSLIRGADTGTTVNKGSVVFASNGLSGWADYEARRLGFFTGSSAGSATEYLSVLVGGPVSLTANVAEKLRIYDGGSAAGSYSLGIAAGDFQLAIPGSGNKFTWRTGGYNGTIICTLSGGGLLTAAQLQTSGYTVATLPAASTALKGAKAYVTDALTPTFLATAVGGGAVVAPVFCNGTNWVVG